MLSYSHIIKKAYQTTISYPLLWLFGLFVVGGFNLNFLHYQNIPFRRLILERRFLEITEFFLQHPGLLALMSLTILLVTLGGLLVSNWSRIMLILLGQSIIARNNLDASRELKQSLKFLWTVIKISLLTSGLILVVALALFGPIWFLDIEPSWEIILVGGGLLLFLPLAFTISCINIFTTFYAVAYQKPFGRALNLGTDLFASRWTQVLGLVVVLMVIYLATFISGVALIFLFRLGFNLLFLLLVKFNILSFSAIIVMLKFISNLLLWLLLAGLSVFFNQALLILFFELNAPVKGLETAAEAKAWPAISL